MKSPWKFRPYGECGMPISDLFPNLGRCADEIALIRSMKSESNNHIPAVYHMLTGHTLSGRPGLGSWVTYGLGTENQNLPAFVVMISQGSGNKIDQPLFARLWGSNCVNNSATASTPAANSDGFAKTLLPT